jgi:Bifunctional DNA primase/polymerase, N-terminal/AAA domain
LEDHDDRDGHHQNSAKASAAGRQIGESKVKKNHEHRQQGTEGKTAPAKDRRARVALRYAKAGLAVLPLHGVTNGRCSCGDNQCDRPGKHPRPKRGIAAATTDPEEIKRLWTKWPHAKIGMVLGGPSKLAALVANGEAGRRSLRAIKETRGSLPSTVTIQDCDRRIRLFRVVANQPRRRDIANGVRILGDGALVVAPSTLSESTNNRRFVPGRALGEIEIAQVPRWLIKLDAAASGVVTGNLAQGAIDIAATAPTGRQWPGGAANGKAGDVIILSAEDAHRQQQEVEGEVRRTERDRAASEERVSSKDPGAPPSPSASASEDSLSESTLTQASRIVAKPIHWLWHKRIPLGAVSMITGHPNLGKSQIAAFLAAMVTTAGELPCCEGRAPLGSVVVMVNEDDIERTVVPRLKAAGADLSKTYVVGGET